MPTRSALAFVSLCAALTPIGCDDDATERDETVEIFSWWVKDGEVEALDAVLAVHQQHYPGVEVVNAAARDSENARALLEQRFAQGFPPDTFQANAGADLLRWVVADGSAANSKLEPLDWLYAEPFAAEIPSDVIAAVSHDGVPYAVPLDIHRNNSLFYNTAVLEEHGVAVPSSLAELHAACETLALADVPCLSIGGKEPWTLALLTWENLLVATAGPDYQHEFLHGSRGSTDPEIEELADELLLLWSYAHPSSASDGWVTAVERLGRGEVAMTVMGDWAKGLLVQQGLEPGTDFGQAAFPGTAGIFVFTADSFSLPKGAVSREGAIDLLRTLASPQGQIAFNRLKGSIPTRSDVDGDELDVLGRQTMAEFGAAERTMLAEADRFSAMQPFLRETVTSGDPELFVNAVRDLYDVLQ